MPSPYTLLKNTLEMLRKHHYFSRAALCNYLATLDPDYDVGLQYSHFTYVLITI